MKKNYGKHQVPLLKRTKRIMKIASLCNLLAVCSVSAASYAQELTYSINKQNSTMIEVFKEIENNSDFTFFYNDNNINVNQEVSVSANNAPIEEILSEVLENTNYSYKIIDKQILIQIAENENTSVAGIAQSKKKVTGKVIDATGMPVIGANVIEKGTEGNGTITDLDGNFSLEVGDNAVLVVSYIGYTNQEIKVGKNSTLAVTLKEDTEILDEVVVVGYGTEKKVNLTGAVSSVSTDEIKDRAQNDVLSAIQGTVPGVTIISRPGENASINFRGRGNLGISEPLYVIDGAIADASFFSNLDPNSIESISFLKDASSSSIYGSRAAYGVVLVTTKKGKEGKMNVSYSGMVGMKTYTYKPDFVNSWEYAELYNEAYYNENPSKGKFQQYSEEQIGWFKDGSKPDLYPNTDWTDLIFDKWAVTTKHSVNFTGGTKKLLFFAGLGYLYDTQIVRNRDDNRYNMNINLSSDITDWLTFRAGIKYIQSNKNVDGGTPNFDNMFIVPSTFVARQSNGDWGSVESGHTASGTFVGGNPLRAYDNPSWIKNKIENTMYELGFDIKPIKGLTITGQGTYKVYNAKNKEYVGLTSDVPNFLSPGTVVPNTGNKQNKMSVTWDSSDFITYTGTVNYEFSKDIHSVSTLAGISYEHYKYEKLFGQRSDFPSDIFEDLSAGATSGSLYSNNSDMQEYKMFSYFARLNYSLMDRYLLEVNFRSDASSRFHKDNRWGYFPSFSVGWRISEERFMIPLRNVIDNLKLRISYGTLGNINNVGNYDYFQKYGNRESIGNPFYYSFDNAPAKVLEETKPANKSLSWEKVAITDIGLDFDLWRGKLGGSIEYYIKNTSDILLGYNVPWETGIKTPPSQNVAKVKNTGFEIALSHRNKINDFSYSVSANLSTNKNKIIDLAASNDIIRSVEHGLTQILREGESIGSFYGLASDGLYTQAEIDAGEYYTYGGVKPNAGDIKFIPQHGQKFGEEITDDDRTIIGCDVPDITYGINLSMNYKNFDLSIFGQGICGTEVAFDVYQLHPFFHGQDNPRVYHLGRWTESNPNPNAIYPRIYPASSVHTSYNRTINSYNIFDADYFRFKTITLGYTFPLNIITKMRLSSLKLYVTGENLITLRADKKMKDFDPETASGTIKNLGSKSFAFGINVSF